MIKVRETNSVNRGTQKRLHNVTQGYYHLESTSTSTWVPFGFWDIFSPFLERSLGLTIRLTSSSSHSSATWSTRLHPLSIVPFCFMTQTTISASALTTVPLSRWIFDSNGANWLLESAKAFVTSPRMSWSDNCQISSLSYLPFFFQISGFETERDSTG